MEANIINFILRKVATKQFAILESAFNNDQNIQVGVTINYGLNSDNKYVVCIARFEYVCNLNPFIILEMECHFEVSDDSWKECINIDQNSVSLPVNFMRHLAVITVGTARGVLHAKTENTPFNQYFLPTINVTEIVQNDMVFSFVKSDHNPDENR